MIFQIKQKKNSLKGLHPSAQGIAQRRPGYIDADKCNNYSLKGLHLSAQGRAQRRPGYIDATIRSVRAKAFSTLAKPCVIYKKKNTFHYVCLPLGSLDVVVVSVLI